MLKAERQDLLLEIIKRKRVVAKELATRLNVSDDTIRRDLIDLDKAKLIRKIHSGAVRLGPPETMFQYRTTQNTKEKRILANLVTSIIQPNSVILIDGGTTNLEFIKALPEDFKAEIITNSPPIAMLLENYNNIETIVLGGKLNNKYMVTMGIDIIEKISKIRADYYLMGIYNIDVSAGLSVPTQDEAFLKKKMAEVSAETIGLITNEKLDTISNHIIGPANILNTLITTSIDTKKYEDLGINVIKNTKFDN